MYIIDTKYYNCLPYSEWEVPNMILGAVITLEMTVKFTKKRLTCILFHEHMKYKKKKKYKIIFNMISYISRHWMVDDSHTDSVNDIDLKKAATLIYN